MSAQAVVRARIDPEVKAQAAEALEAMGLSLSDAIRMLLVRIAAEKALPFPAKVPNATTLEAMRELEEGGGARFDTVEALFEDLRI